MYMAVQYAFVGIAQTWKDRNKGSIDDDNPNEEDMQSPVFLLEAKLFANEPEDINSANCFFVSASLIKAFLIKGILIILFISILFILFYYILNTFL